MKVSLWLFTLSLVILCFVCWALCHVLVDIWRNEAEAVALPLFTRLAIQPWLLLYPVPWIIYAASLTRRKDIQPGAVFLFAGTISFAAVTILSVFAFAAILPYASSLPLVV